MFSSFYHQEGWHTPAPPCLISQRCPLTNLLSIFILPIVVFCLITITLCYYGLLFYITCMLLFILYYITDSVDHGDGDGDTLKTNSN